MSIATTNGDSVPLSGIGTIVTPSLSLYDVYYIHSLAMNLASAGKICDSSYNVYFSPSDSLKVIGIGYTKGGLFVLNQFKELIVATSSKDLSSFLMFSSSSAFYLWHSRLGHIFTSHLNFLASTRVLATLDNHDILIVVVVN